MKHFLLALAFLSAPAYAGTMTTSFGSGGGTITTYSNSGLGTITYSSGSVTGIAIDTATFYVNPNTGGALHPKWNITVGNGNSAGNKVLFVLCDYTYSVGGTIISSVTVNGAPNAFTFSQRATDTSNTLASELWYYVNPPVGSDSIEVNPTNSLTDARQQCFALDLVGVDQTTPIESSTTVVNASSPASTNLTITTNGDWSLNSFIMDSSNVPTPTNGQTVVSLVNPDASIRGYTYRGPLAPGTFADSYTFAALGMTSVIGAVKPAP